MSKKLIVAAIVAMLAFGAYAMATEARLETLGNQGLYLMDDTNIFGNPATQAYYPDMVRIHMSGYDGSGDTYAYGGGTLSVGDALTLGAFAARNPSLEEGGIGSVTGDAIGAPVGVDLDGDTIADITVPVFNSVWDLDGDTTPDTPGNAVVNWENPFDIILAYKMDNLAVGISYYLANEKLKYKDDIADTKYTARAYLHSLKVGLSYKMDNMTPEAWFHWDPYSIKTKYTDDPADTSYEENLKGNKIVLGGRLFYNLNDNLAVVPAINWEYVNGNLDIDSDPDISLTGGGTEEDLGQKYTSNAIVTGVSLQYKADKLFLVGSLGLKWSKFVAKYTVDNASDYEDKLTSKDFAVPVAALGLEYQATKVVMLRAGMNTTTVWAASTALEDESDSSGDLTDTSLLQTYQSTTASIGMGLKFGNLCIDTVFGNWLLVNEEGNANGPSLFSNLDVKYVF